MPVRRRRTFFGMLIIVKPYGVGIKKCSKEWNTGSSSLKIVKKKPFSRCLPLLIPHTPFFSFPKRRVKRKKEGGLKVFLHIIFLNLMGILPCYAPNHLLFSIIDLFLCLTVRMCSFFLGISNTQKLQLQKGKGIKNP